MVGSARYFRSHLRLLLRVTRNELSARYAGSLFGVGWTVLAPTLILTLYGVVYLRIFRLAAGGLSESEYVLYLFSGLVPFLMTAEALGAGVSAVVANRAVLSNTVFPIDLAPVKAVLMAQPTMAVGLIIVAVGSVIVGTVHATMLLVPLVWALHIAGLMGIIWILSVLNVAFRDLQNLITVLILVLLVVTPIAYTPDMVPAALQPLVDLNPFAYYVIAYQDLLVLGELPTLTQSLVIVCVSLGSFFSGSWFFSRMKRAMLDYV